MREKKLFIMKPSNSNLFHIFGKDHRSLCGKIAVLFVTDDSKEYINGTETYQRRQDCKACFRKADLNIK